MLQSPSVNITDSLSVPGYMSEDELEWLAQRARGCNFIAEIGCWMGRSTKAFAKHCKGWVLAVDTWEGCLELDFERPDIPENDIYRNFLAYTSPNKNVISCRMPSLVAAQSLRDHGIVISGIEIHMPAFDLVFIDGLHDYDNVKADILAWMPCVRNGGILCGHDFHHPPVRQVVTELFGPEHAENNPSTRMWEVQVRWEPKAA